MEADKEFRERLKATTTRYYTGNQLPESIADAFEMMSGAALDECAKGLGITRHVGVISDPFGDAVRAAQAKAEAEPTVIPHPVQPVPVEDHDALWRSIQDYGKGG